MRQVKASEEIGRLGEGGAASLPFSDGGASNTGTDTLFSNTMNALKLQPLPFTNVGKERISPDIYSLDYRIPNHNHSYPSWSQHPLEYAHEPEAIAKVGGHIVRPAESDRKIR